MLKTIFNSKRKRKQNKENVHNEELHNLYFSANVIMNQIKAEITIQIKEMRNSHTALIGNTREQKSFGRSRGKQKHDIRIDIKETVCEVVEWIGLVED